MTDVHDAVALPVNTDGWVRPLRDRSARPTGFALKGGIPVEGIVTIVVVVLIVLFVLGYFGRGKFRV